MASLSRGGRERCALGGDFGLDSGSSGRLSGCRDLEITRKTELGAVVETPRGAGGRGIREGSFSTRVAPYPPYPPYPWHLIRVEADGRGVLRGAILGSIQEVQVVFPGC